MNRRAKAREIRKRKKPFNSAVRKRNVQQRKARILREKAKKAAEASQRSTVCRYRTPSPSALNVNRPEQAIGGTDTVFKYEEIEDLNTEFVIKVEQDEENVPLAEDCTLNRTYTPFTHSSQWLNTHESGVTTASVINVEIKQESAADDIPIAEEGAVIDSPLLVNIRKKEVIVDSGDVEHYSDDVESATATPYICKTCNRQFSSETLLENHTRTHPGEKRYQCKMCNQEFSQKHYLTIHTRIHTGEKPYKCNKCPRQFICRDFLESHGKSHTEAKEGDKSYKCDVCHRTFSSNGYLMRHTKAHSSVRFYECGSCSKHFHLLCNLMKHTKTHTEERPYQHEGYSRSDETTLANMRTPEAMKSEYIFNKEAISLPYSSGQHITAPLLVELSAAFKAPDSSSHTETPRGHENAEKVTLTFSGGSRTEGSRLNTHESGVTTANVINPDVEIKQESAEDDIPIAEEGEVIDSPLLVNIRKKEVIVDSGDVEHYSDDVESATATPYICKTCNRQFSSETLLEKHSRTHPGVKRYECTVCKQLFSKKYYLTIHTRLHTGKRPYKCDTCPRQFICSGFLRRHIRTHTEEKTWECDICHRKFAYRNQLVVHKRIHTDEKPYYCDLCRKDFRRKRDLSVHIKTHSSEIPHKCKTCTREFSSETRLTIHTTLHTGEKPYKCDTCPRQFISSGFLRRHIRNHTEEKTWEHECGICHRKFANRNQLLLHTRIHADKMPDRLNKHESGVTTANVINPDVTVKQESEADNITGE